jgi:glutamate synthase (NADPH/NADH) small chain
VREGLVAELGVALDARGNVSTDAHHMTSVDGVFAAGDVRRGASLIVWAIREGRDAARGVDRWLRARQEWRERGTRSRLAAALV